MIVVTERIHDARVIPLEGGRIFPPPSINGWGIRGHWEGNTLVVDTTNDKPRAFRNVSSEKLHVIERFNRTGPETLKYEITIDDPDTRTKPWSLMIPLRPTRIWRMLATPVAWPPPGTCENKKECQF